MEKLQLQFIAMEVLRLVEKSLDPSITVEYPHRPIQTGDNVDEYWVWNNPGTRRSVLVAIESEESRPLIIYCDDVCALVTPQWDNVLCMSLEAFSERYLAPAVTLITDKLNERRKRVNV